MHQKGILVVKETVLKGKKRKSNTQYFISESAAVIFTLTCLYLMVWLCTHCYVIQLLFQLIIEIMLTEHKSKNVTSPFWYNNACNEKHCVYSMKRFFTLEKISIVLKIYNILNWKVNCFCIVHYKIPPHWSSYFILY